MTEHGGSSVASSSSPLSLDGLRDKRRRITNSDQDRAAACANDHSNREELAGTHAGNDTRYTEDIAMFTSRFLNAMSLSTEHVHIVRVRLDCPLEGAVAFLDQVERDHAARFVFERDRRRYIVAHAWLRLILSYWLGCRPDAVRFSRGPYGKPVLAKSSCDLRFNLSHSGERALIACTLGREVGVDIEIQRPVDVSLLATRLFSPAEFDAVRVCEPAQALSEFFRCWTRKEALLKAMGCGLNVASNGIDVILPNDQTSQLWRVCDLVAEPGYVSAVASSRGTWRVYEWDHYPGSSYGLTCK